MSRIEERIQSGKHNWADKFDSSDLHQKFHDAYNRGDKFRIKVKFPYGETVWGYVATTTGWKPVFILMRTRVQRGSHMILCNDCEILDSRYLP